MIESPRGPPDLLRATCSTTAVLVTLLTVVSVKVVFVMDSVTTAGLFTVTADGRVTLTLSLDLDIENLAIKILHLSGHLPDSIWNHGVK